MSSPRIIVLIPAQNEQDTVAAVVRSVREHSGWDVLVINDASSDATAAEARAAGARVLDLLFSLGAWGAAQTGLRYAERRGYDIAVTMDADGQHRAETLPPLCTPLLEGRAAVAIGSFPARGSAARRFAWGLFRLISGARLEDLTSGLRAYDREAIACLASPAATLLDYQDMGVLLLLRQARLRICEVPLPMQPRLTGQSRIFSSWWAVGRYMLYTLTLSLARSQPFPATSKQPKQRL